MTVSFLAECAESILDAAEAALVEATTGREPPSHVFVAHGEPAWDNCCDGGQLSVHLVQVLHDPQDVTAGGAIGGSPQYGCMIEPKPTFAITLLRCVTPPGDSMSDVIPAPGDVDDDAQGLLTDLWALLTELYDRIAACVLIPGMSNCRDAFVIAATPLDEEGGCAGWQVTVGITANDAGPVGS